MSAARARAAIGLPVHNGGDILCVAVDSILNQTFRDFELIISDNASTDQTEAICRDYAAKDGRVRYRRNATNIGITRNFNLTFQSTAAEYFRWAAHDDVLDARCLERCVEVLDGDPTVVLCHTNTRIIDRHGRVIGHHSYSPDHAGAACPSRRFRDVLAEDRWCLEVFGLVRSAAMGQTRLQGPYVGSDRILRAELALMGRYHIVPEYLFFNRDHPARATRTLPTHHLRASLLDPGRRRRRTLPHWRIFAEYARSIRRASLSARERRACYRALTGWLGQDANWARLAADLVIAVRPSTDRWFLRLAGGGAHVPPSPGGTRLRGDAE